MATSKADKKTMERQSALTEQRTIPRGMRVKVLDEDGNPTILVMASCARDRGIADAIANADAAARALDQLNAKRVHNANEAEKIGVRLRDINSLLEGSAVAEVGDNDAESRQSSTTSLPKETVAGLREDRLSLLDTLTTLMEDGSDMIEETSALTDAYNAAVADAYRKSFQVAGYTPDEVDFNMSLLDLGRFPELRVLLRTGCGMADFSSRGA